MRALRAVASVSLVIAAVGVLITPAFLSADYSVLSNSISESGAQGVDGAWLGRLTLLASGIGVLAATASRRGQWNRVALGAMSLFGAMWCLTAAFSTRSWIVDAAYDERESSIHSLLATLMAVVIIGALAVAFSRRTADRTSRALAIVLALAATFLPLAGVIWPQYAGLFQRAMFLYTYVWFFRETHVASR